MTRDPADAVATRRREVEQRLADTERRLAEVRTARGDWTDEEHDPEGFALTFEWQQAEGMRVRFHEELADLDAAAGRIAAGEYGTCTRCGAPIPAEQLTLRPARTTCVACAEKSRR